MLEHAREAVKIAHGRSRQDLGNDRMFNLAETRLLEIIGEAARRVPIDYQLEHPEIPWSQIIGLRNRLIHGYDAIDFDILWAIIQNDMPQLIKQLEDIL
ncbi:MAG: DUF86 domain-containing protein [Anaerolineae bacterium]|nr:MAG: DUF86 domain-containing protein [Anaerolineae bacterium]